MDLDLVHNLKSKLNLLTLHMGDMVAMIRFTCICNSLSIFPFFLSTLFIIFFFSKVKIFTEPLHFFLWFSK